METTAIASFWSKGLRKNTEVWLLPSIVVKSDTLPPPPPPSTRNILLVADVDRKLSVFFLFFFLFIFYFFFVAFSWFGKCKLIVMWFGADVLGFARQWALEVLPLPRHSHAAIGTFNGGRARRHSPHLDGGSPCSRPSCSCSCS